MEYDCRQSVPSEARFVDPAAEFVFVADPAAVPADATPCLPGHSASLISLVWRAAERLSLPVQAAAPAVEAGLVEFGGRVRFRHPLARSAAYRSAPLPDRQQMHAAPAEVTDAQAEPDRRAWNRAQAALGPDEQAAAELERSAGRAQARGGLAAAAAFLESAVALTVDAARHAERALAAAQGSLEAGAFGKALDLLATAEAGPLDEFQRARPTSCAAMSPSSRGLAAMLPRCFCGPPGSSSRSTWSSRARRT